MKLSRGFWPSVIGACMDQYHYTLIPGRDGWPLPAGSRGKALQPRVECAAPQGGLRFGVYGIVQNKLHPYFDFAPLQNALAACAGDISSSFVKVPREVITQRLQTVCTGCVVCMNWVAAAWR
jgi:hypothetical protein